MTCPSLELPAVAGAVEHEKPRGWKADTAAPGESEAAVRLDKVVEIALPVVIEVAEEHQPAAVADEGPMRKVNRPHASQITIRGGGANEETEPQVPCPRSRNGSPKCYASPVSLVRKCNCCAESGLSTLPISRRSKFHRVTRSVKLPSSLAVSAPSCLYRCGRTTHCSAI